MKSTQNNVKCTWPMSAPHYGDPTPPTFHLLALGVGVGGNANFSVFRYQHVDIANEHFTCWGADPMQSPSASSFASPWNIGFNLKGNIYFQFQVSQSYFCLQPSFVSWLQNLRVSSQVRNKLRKENIVCLQDLLVLTKEDFDDLGLSVGERSRLRAALKKLKH